MAQASRKKSEGRRIPAWLIFLVGAIVGATAMGMFSSQDGRDLKQKIQDRMSQNKPDKAPDNKPPKPRFDFYTVLPEMEVVIPDEEIQKPVKPEVKPKPEEKTTPPAQTAKVEAAGGNAVYLLQMGSFRSFTDADRLKARLGFMGIESDIQSVTISNEQGKTTVHRVRGGPYSQAQAQELHRSLKQSQISSMVIRLKR
jgi:cell division protein FtsN